MSVKETIFKSLGTAGLFVLSVGSLATAVVTVNQNNTLRETIKNDRKLDSERYEVLSKQVGEAQDKAKESKQDASRLSANVTNVEKQVKELKK